MSRAPHVRVIGFLPVIFVLGASPHSVHGQAVGQIFEIDGNAQFDDGTLDGVIDWATGDGIGIPALQCANRDCRGVAGISFFSADAAGMSVFSGNRSSDSDDISSWRWANSPVPDRYDLLHGMAYSFEDALGDRWVALGADREGGGTGWSVSAWILSRPIRLLGDGSFSGTHTPIDPVTSRPRDVLVVSEFTSNGILVSSQLLVWGPNGPMLPPFGTVDSTVMAAAVNIAPVCAPWQYGGTAPPSCPTECTECFPPMGFLEMAVNLGAWGFSGSGECGQEVGTIIISSRTSSALNSQLHDFVIFDSGLNSTASLDDGTDGAFVRLAASSRGQSGNLEDQGTLVCGSIPRGVGYDISQASLWLTDSDDDTSLYVSVDLNGHPGDSDGDGAYGSTASSSADCSGFGYACPIVEGSATDSIFHGVEGMTLEIDRDLDGAYDLAFLLQEDEFIVSRNDYDGPRAGAVIGGRGTTWAAAPLVPDRDCLPNSLCLDVANRKGNILVRIPSWQTYFSSGLGYAVFDTRVIGSGDGGGAIMTDVVEVPFRRTQPALAVTSRLERSSTSLCSSGDTVLMRVDVTNRGAALLDTIEIKTQVPLSFLYSRVVSDPDGLGEPRESEEFGVRKLSWGSAWDQPLITLAPQATKTVEVEFLTQNCVGTSRSYVSAEALRRYGTSSGDKITALCSRADVSVEAVPGVVCGSGSLPEIPFRVTNTGTDEEQISLSGLVDGVPASVVPSILTLAAGSVGHVRVKPNQPVAGESVRAVLEATARVSRVTDAACEVTKTAESVESLVTPHVEVLPQVATQKFPPGEAGYAHYRIINHGPALEEVSLSGTFNASPADSIRPPSLTTLASGANVDVQVWGRMPNPCAGDIVASIEVSSSLQAPEGCTITALSNALSQCSSVRLTLLTPGDKTYRGVSFPLQSGPSGSDLLSTVRAALGQQQNHEHWRLFGWDGARRREVDATNADLRLNKIEPGAGYWLITDERDETLDLSGDPVGLGGEYTITLDQPDTAWFQIAVPFLRPYSVDAIQVESPEHPREPIAAGTLVECEVQEWEPEVGREGSYAARRTLLPGRAYWIKKVVPGPVYVHFAPPSGLGSAPVESPESMPRGADWAVRIQARHGEKESSPIWMGAVAGNEELAYRMDLSLAPPPPEGYGLLLFLPRDDAGLRSGSYLREFRPRAETMTWDVEARQKSRGPIELAVGRWGVPEELSVRLLDLDSGAAYAIRSSTTVVLSDDQLARRMRVVVAREGSLPSEAPPAAPMVYAVFPNPFRALTALRMALSERSEVHVRVYDALGRGIAVPFEGFAGPGELIVQWNGKDKSGQSAASGIYFLEIRLGLSRTTQRIVKLRD